MPGAQLKWEKWADCGDEILRLAGSHFAEVEGELAKKRPYDPDAAGLASLNSDGVLHLLTGREASGRLVGYFTWNVYHDLESMHLIIALQGAWYVAESHRRTRLGVRLFDESLHHLRNLGVSNIFLHHRTQGAGANIGRFFRRRGATPMQVNYSLWIGD